jgi:hypothetical protein
LSVRFFYKVVARMRAFFHSAVIDEDVEQKMAAYLAASEEHGIRSGFTREEVRRGALIRLGGLSQLREGSRAAQGLPGFDCLPH